MEIPVQNIYFLLCYAWDKLEEKEVVDVDSVGITELVDLFARVLINGTNHLLKRGFDRSYVPQDEWTGRLRGKIDFQTAAKSAVRTATLPCRFDEFSYDVLHNQILKATIRRLSRARGIKRDNADALVGITRQLAEVRDIDVVGRHFGQVQLHRNNQFYDFLMKLCELIHHNLLISEDAGKSRFSDFTQDEGEMRRLFEAFVRNFFHRHSRYTVASKRIEWLWSPEDAAAAGMLPKMQTDVTLAAKDRKIIIECKYTPRVTQHHYHSDADTLRSAHIYQLNSYLDNLPPEDAGCEAVLLYPTTEKVMAHSYRHKQHRISIRTIDLNQAWQGIHADLLAMVA